MNKKTTHDTLPNMSVTRTTTHTDEQLEILERFDRALDTALEAGIHPACLHSALGNHGTPLRIALWPPLRPNGWETIPGAPVDPLRSPTPGTPEAHAEIFRPMPTVDPCKAAERLRDFKRCAALALQLRSQANLHRTIDAAYWSLLSEMFGRACDHAWAAKIAAPSNPFQAA